MTVCSGYGYSRCRGTWNSSRDPSQQGHDDFLILFVFRSLRVQRYQVGAEYQRKLSSSSPSMKKRCNCLLCVHCQIARRAYPYYVASAAEETEGREACLPWLPRGSSIQQQPDGCSCFCSQGFPQANSTAFLPPSCHLHLWDCISLSLFSWNEHLADFSNFKSSECVCRVLICDLRRGWLEC